jgi:hypothetical protein
MFCAGNEQNIDGTRRMAENFTRPQVAEIRQNRPLHVLVVPARVDRAQNDLQNEFLIQFFTDFQDYLPSEAESLQKYRIPYVPLYSYKEVVAVREKDEHRVPDMVDAFAELVKFMAQFAPAESILPLAISRLGLALSKGGPLTPAELRGGDVGSAPESGSLTSAQRQQLQRALVSGFPNKDELIQVVSVGLDQEAMLSNVQTNALDLAATAIEQAEKHGRVEDLVIAALAANPDHQNLRLVALQLGHRTRVAAQRAAESWKVPTTAIPEPPDPGLRPNAESIERFRRQAGLSTGIARFIFGKAETE